MEGNAEIGGGVLIEAERSSVTRLIVSTPPQTPREARGPS
jgi:hypothetical protein